MVPGNLLPQVCVSVANRLSGEIAMITTAPTQEEIVALEKSYSITFWKRPAAGVQHHFGWACSGETSRPSDFTVTTASQRAEREATISGIANTKT